MKHFLEIKKRDAKCLDEICKSCDQRCSYDASAKKYSCVCEKGYDLDEGTKKCVPGPKVDLSKCKGNETTDDPDLPPAFLRAGSSLCLCPSGFRYNKKTKVCDVDQALAAKFGCSKVELKKQIDRQPGCVCLEGQQFDASTRKCLPRCTEEKTKDCSARGAKCSILEGHSQCHCAEGFVFFAEVLGNLIDSTCIDKCQLIEKYPQLATSKYVYQIFLLLKVFNQTFNFNKMHRTISAL